MPNFTLSAVKLGILYRIFNRGVNMVQEILEENKNGDAIFNFDDISTFKVTVMSADPKKEYAVDDIEEKGRTEAKDNDTDGTDDGTDYTGQISKRERKVIALTKEDKKISKKNIAKVLGIGTSYVWV